MAFPLLGVAAVPFTFGSNDSSLASRRRFRRQNGCRSDANPSAPFGNLDPTQRAVVASIVSEAAKEIQSVMGLGPRQDLESENFPAAPPNSPNDHFTFDFPVPADNRSDVLRRNVETEFSSEEEATEQPPEKPKRTRSFRKRRRVPSFKTGHQPRVPAKVGCCSEADDEASEAETLAVSRSKFEADTDTDTDIDTKTEMELKLNLLSETRRSRNNDEVEDWARVGTELRNIADSFQKGLDGDGDDASGVDIFSLINLMLPVSVPQSLWSALFSYAAWKIFKRFQ
jgi:hypothetical protein